jgi:AAA family ATPase
MRGQLLYVNYKGRQRRLSIAQVKRAKTSNGNGKVQYAIEFFLVGSNTAVSITHDKASIAKAKRRQIESARLPNKSGYEAVGGLDSQIEQIRELVELPLTRPELYAHFGQPPFYSPLPVNRFSQCII